MTQSPAGRGVECDSRWAAYCLSLILAGGAALVWFLSPTPRLALLVLVFATLGLSYTLGLVPGILWSAIASAYLVLLVRGPSGWEVAIALVGGGTAIVYGVSKRASAGVLLMALAPLGYLTGWSLLPAVVAVAAGLFLAVDARRLHVASISFVAPLLALAPPGWVELAAALVVVTSAIATGALESPGCPFRRENALLTVGVAVFGASLLAVAARPQLALSAFVEALAVLGLLLVISGLLAPRPHVGVFLGDKDAGHTRALQAS